MDMVSGKRQCLNLKFVESIPFPAALITLILLPLNSTGGGIDVTISLG